MDVWMFLARGLFGDCSLEYADRSALLRVLSERIENELILRQIKCCYSECHIEG